MHVCLGSCPACCWSQQGHTGSAGPGTDTAPRERVVGRGGVREAGGLGGPGGAHLTSTPQKVSGTAKSRAWSPRPLRPSPGLPLEGLACVQRSQEVCFCCPQPRIWAAARPGNFNSKYGKPTGWLSGPTPPLTSEGSERQRGELPKCVSRLVTELLRSGRWPTASGPGRAGSGSCPSPRAALTQAALAAGARGSQTR